MACVRIIICSANVRARFHSFIGTRNSSSQIYRAFRAWFSTCAMNEQWIIARCLVLKTFRTKHGHNTTLVLSHPLRLSAHLHCCIFLEQKSCQGGWKVLNTCSSQFSIHTISVAIVGCLIQIRPHLSAVSRNGRDNLTLWKRRHLGCDPVATQLRQAREG
mgnify:CR=1 FL=1